jgi:hypothetical protein
VGWATRFPSGKLRIVEHAVIAFSNRMARASAYREDVKPDVRSDVLARCRVTCRIIQRLMDVRRTTVNSSRSFNSLIISSRNFLTHELAIPTTSGSAEVTRCQALFDKTAKQRYLPFGEMNRGHKLSNSPRSFSEALHHKSMLRKMQGRLDPKVAQSMASSVGDGRSLRFVVRRPL